MKKRFLGIKLSSILTVIVCLVIAMAIWMLVNLDVSPDSALVSARTFFKR